MHTTSTPGQGNSNPMTPGIPSTNPNPASGTIIVTMQDNYSRIYSGGYSVVSPLGTSVSIDSGLTAGVAYVVTVVGDATAADWLAIGMPAGLLVTNPSTGLQAPNIGASFIATSTGSGSSSVTRVAPTAASGSGIMSIETVGDSNQAIDPLPASHFGARVILQCRNNSGAIAAPADGSVISLSFLLSNSSVQIAGE